MNLEYSLSENDFLKYSLFSASQNRRTMNQKRRSWILLTIAFIMVSVPFYGKDNLSFYFFISFAIITFVFYPFYQKKIYERHYRKYVIDNYKARFEEVSTLIFNDEQVELQSLIGETKINYTVIEQIDETGEYFFLKLRTGGALIIPKRKIKELPSFEDFLDSLARKNNWKKVTNLDWKW